jgi:hypothetical protein
VTVRDETTRFQGLDFLGFPWILSSESRLFNELHGFFCGIFFVSLLPRFCTAAREPVVDAIRKRWVAHEASLSEILDFRNGLSSGRLPSWRRAVKGRLL